MLSSWSLLWLDLHAAGLHPHSPPRCWLLCRQTAHGRAATTHHDDRCGYDCAMRMTLCGCRRVLPVKTAPRVASCSHAMQ